MVQPKLGEEPLTIEAIKSVLPPSKDVPISKRANHCYWAIKEAVAGNKDYGLVTSRDRVVVNMSQLENILKDAGIGVSARELKEAIYRHPYKG